MTVHNVFFDTNVFDDFFCDGPSAYETEKILEYVKRGVIVGYTSPKTLLDIYYLIHSEKGAFLASKRVKQIYSLMKITSIGNEEIKSAIALGWTDFEDAVQLCTAKKYGADKLITLDKKFRNKDKSFLWTPADLHSYLIQNIL